jgi:hypothetical protein
MLHTQSHLLSASLCDCVWAHLIPFSNLRLKKRKFWLLNLMNPLNSLQLQKHLTVNLIMKKYDQILFEQHRLMYNMHHQWTFTWTDTDYKLLCVIIQCSCNACMRYAYTVLSLLLMQLKSYTNQAVLPGDIHWYHSMISGLLGWNV